MTETIHFLVNVMQDTRDIFVRLKSTNVNRIPANITAIVKILLEAIDVDAYQELQEPIVR